MEEHYSILRDENLEKFCAVQQRLFFKSALAATLRESATSATFPSHEMAPFFGVEDRGVCVRFSPDGEVLVYSSSNTIFLFSAAEVFQNVQARAQLVPIVPCLSLEDPGFSILDVGWSPTGDLCAVSSWNQNIRLYRRVDGTSFEVRADDNERVALFGLDWLSERQLVTCSNYHQTIVLDIAHGVTWRCDTNLRDVNCVCAVNRNVILSGSDDCTIALCDTRSSDDVIGHFVGHSQGITSIALRGDGYHFATNSKDQSTKLYDLRKMRTGHMPATASVVMRSGREWDYRYGLAMGPPPRIGFSFDNSIATFWGNSCAVTLCRVCFSPLSTTSGRYVFAGGCERGVTVFDIFTGDRKIVAGSHSSVVRDVAYHPSLPLVATACLDGCLRFFSLTPSKQSLLEKQH